MTALPFQLDPGPADPGAGPGWTPLRVGLALAWAAALVALAAVGLGGWSLLNLSERRIRFVSAVTHELRTPLTTLRLYLDMLMNGLVRDEKQREEYIRTLNAEANRLSRLVGNVLDYSRLEKQRPRLNRSRESAADLLAQVGAVWQGRCHDAGQGAGDRERRPPSLRRPSARTASWCSRSSATCWTTPASTAAAPPTAASGCACAAGAARPVRGGGPRARRAEAGATDDLPRVPPRPGRGRRGGRRRRAGAGAGAELGAAARRRADAAADGGRGVLPAVAAGSRLLNSPSGR